MNEAIPGIPTFRSDPLPAERRPDSHEEVVLRGGDRVLIRPVQREDAELERRFIEALSPESRRFRFFETLLTPSPALLDQLTVLDPATDVAFVAVVAEGKRERAVGVGRFSADAAGHDCEFALTVAEEWQKKGLASHLMTRLIAVAKARGIVRMHSSDAAHNSKMRDFATHLHLSREADPDDATLVVYSVDLTKDRSQFIDLTLAPEVADWRRSLGCSESELRNAVATVGNSAARVRGYLTGQTGRAVD
ncbi:MAG: GNAT family N-acetyltransferase [Pseudomonadota bacterium]|nr:GNAT family N-acetyltransferase [Pseudomonadota bacterium]